MFRIVRMPPIPRPAAGLAAVGILAAVSGLPAAPLHYPAAPLAEIDSAGRLPEAVAAARGYFLLAREAERKGEISAALAWYGLAFRRDAGSRDLCFLYLERLKDAGAVDSAVAVGRACAALAQQKAGRNPGGAPAPAPLSAGEHKLLGEVALRADDSPAALRHYRAADSLAKLGGRGEDDGDALYVLAGLYEESGDWEAYADVVERLLPRLDYPPRLMDRLLRAYARADRLRDVEPVLRAAWEETANPQYGQALAALYDSKGRNLSLLEVARRLAILQPDPEHDWMLARAYAAADRPDSALAVCGRLLKAQPDHPGLRYLQASLLFERGRYKEALQGAEELVEDFPGVAAYHQLEGSAALELRKRGARRALERALALEPLALEFRARLAYADYALGTPAAAGARLAYAATDSLNAEQALLLEGLAHGMLARNLEPRGAWERPSVFSDSAASRRHRRLSLARFEAILAKNSGHRAALFEAGALLERLGERERSKALFRRLIERDTANALAMNYLAYTIVEQDTIAPAEFAESGRLLDRAVALDPENGAYRDSKGWWHYRGGAFDSARVWLESAIDAVPDDPAVLDHLAQALYALDEREEACAVWRRLMALDPARRFYLHCPAREAGAESKRDP
jgi:Flp pilus assembly protein TadD